MKNDVAFALYVELKAKIVLYELERKALIKEIPSPKTKPERRAWIYRRLERQDFEQRCEGGEPYCTFLGGGRNISRHFFSGGQAPAFFSNSCEGSYPSLHRLLKAQLATLARRFWQWLPLIGIRKFYSS